MKFFSFKKVETFFSRILPPTLYKFIFFRYSMRKVLTNLLIPPIINQNNSLKSLRADGLYGVHNYYHDIKRELWDTDKTIKSREEQLRGIDPGQRIIPNLHKAESIFLLLIDLFTISKICRVLDFGGAAGHFYHMLKNITINNDNLEWHVIDLPKTIALGKKFVKENDNLYFYEKLPATDQRFDIIYTNAVLQYIENYKDIIRQLSKYGAEYMFFVRLPAYTNPEFFAAQVIGGNETPYIFMDIQDIIGILSECNYEIFFATSCTDYKEFIKDIPQHLRIPYDAILIFKRKCAP